MDRMPQSTKQINLQNALELLHNLAEVLAQASQTGSAAHQVESMIFSRMRQIGLSLLEEFFTLCGPGDEGPEKTLPTGRKLKRLPELHAKPYLSVFGETQVRRTVYASRQGQKHEYVPLDATLQLPQDKYSYLLLDWSQGMSVDMPYAQVNRHLERILGLTPSISALERQNQDLGESVQGFWEQRETAPKAGQDEIVVTTADGKGIPIRSPEGGKKMSVIGSVYTIEPYQRTPQDVLAALFAEPGQPEKVTQTRPKPTAKQVRASLQRDENDTMQPAYDGIFAWLAEQTQQRNPNQTQPHVVLMDGQDSLWNAARRHFGDDTVEILDVIHAAGYIRQAASLFHTQVKLQEVFARFVMGYLLQGQVGTVLIILDIWAEEHPLTRSQLRELHGIRGYLLNNIQRMRYGEYLARGYPIASGVIEGACRYVIKDRMERTGMRWTLAGAQTMLGLRCISVNEEWEGFISFHVAQENRRLYPWKAANDELPSLRLVA